MEERAYELYMRGSHMLSTGNPAQAALLLERASGLEAEKSSIWESLGRARFAMRWYDQAAAAFARTLEIDPCNHYAHYALAVSYELLGMLDAAAGHIKLALAMAPENNDYELAYARIKMRGAP